LEDLPNLYGLCGGFTYTLRRLGTYKFQVKYGGYAMSYLVCHVQKFKSNDIKGIQIHNQRESENSKNKDIDISKTQLNYDLHNGIKINYNNKVKDILDKGYLGSRAIRKDAVVMTSTIISSDKDFFNDLSIQEKRDFFKSAYDKLSEIYGEKNIVSATVHFDEHTPHMHLCSVPLTEDGKLSAKTLFDRKSLRNLQDELPKHLNARGFNIQRGESSDSKHVDTNEHKKQQARIELHNLNSNAQKLKEDIKTLTSDKEAITSEIRAIKRDYDNILDVRSCISDIDAIESKKSLTGSKMTIKVDDYKLLMALAKQGVYNDNRIKDLERDYENLKRSSNSDYLKTKELSSDKFRLLKKVSYYEGQYKILLTERAALIKVADKHGLLGEVNKELNPPKPVQKKNRNLDYER